ncbi:class I SAM-dependent methyltransferase [bacterium]|nr:class I SAM-dependent methyltransferase [bacterium]
MDLKSHTRQAVLPQWAIGTLGGLAGAWWLFMQIVNRRRLTAGTLLGFATALFALGTLLAETFMRIVMLNRRSISNQRQMQGILGLYHELKPEHALPLLGDAALQPLTALHYVKLIRQTKPDVVVELGSGVSTLLASLQLQKNGSGKVYAYDHEQKWARRTTNDMALHGMETWAEIRHAPLTSFQQDGRTLHWYDPAKFEDLEKIDVLLVDGPPDYDDNLQRRAGLTVLADKFHDDTVILIDDAERSTWNQFVRQWAAQHGFIAEELFQDYEHGLFLFKRGSRFHQLLEGE